MPDPTFKSYRTGRDIIGARQLPRRCVERCRVIESREAMLDELPEGGVVAEIGVQRGFFANEILTRMRPAAYHGFDLYLNQIRFDEFPGLRDPRVRFYAGDSSTNLAALPKPNTSA